MLIMALAIFGFVLYVIVDHFQDKCFKKPAKPKVENTEQTDLELRPLE